MHAFSPFRMPKKPIMDRFFRHKTLILIPLLLAMSTASVAEKSLTLE